MTLESSENAIDPLTPSEPVPGTVNHLRGARLRPDFKRAVAYGLLALVAAVLVRVYGDLTWSSFPHSLIALAGSIAFVTLSVLSVRSVANEVASVSRARFGDAHAAVVALLLTLIGYAATTVSLLLLLDIAVQRLLVSGAVTGVVLGIAAQQSLANVVAGLVLLLNRPFQVGHDLTVRSGSLGGPYSGRVLSIGLTYVQLQTAEGVVLLPNSGVLAAVVGPRVPVKSRVPDATVKSRVPDATVKSRVPDATVKSRVLDALRATADSRTAAAEAAAPRVPAAEAIPHVSDAEATAVLRIPADVAPPSR